MQLIGIKARLCMKIKFFQTFCEEKMLTNVY